MPEKQPEETGKQNQQDNPQIERLILSIEKLNNSINRSNSEGYKTAMVMERLTWMILGLTLIQAVLTIFFANLYIWQQITVYLILMVGVIILAKKIAKMTK